MAERLQAGDLKVILADGPELRNIRFFDVVILDGLALTVRDTDWGTVPGQLVSRSITSIDSEVRVSQTWRFSLPSGTLVGDLDVRLEPRALTVALRTEVDSTIEVNRAGLVLLHPLELAGRRVTLVGPTGRHEDHFPERVSPHQPFRDLRGMAYAPVDGLTVSLDLGDLPYETEDHRNWCDAGWKSYTPPLAHPLPLRLNPGERHEQQVRATVSSDRPPGRRHRDQAPRVVVRPVVSGVLPALGWGAGPQPPGGVSGLPGGPGFLSVEVLANEVGRTRLDHAVAQARARRLPLRVTVATTATEADSVAEGLSGLAPWLSHVCLVDRDLHVSNEPLVRAAATAFAGTAVAVGAGTRGYLAELGRSAAGFGLAQFVQLSVSAEVHHDDDERILDTTRALPFVVDSARAAAGGLPLLVAPITLAQRLSVHQPGDDRYAPWDRAVEPDRRSGEALGVAWCLASVAGLVGAEALSFFSVAAGHGLFDAAARATPTAILLSELARHQGRAVLRCDVSDPRVVSALALRDGNAVTLYLANLAARPMEVMVERSGTVDPVLLRAYEVRRLARRSPETAGPRAENGRERKDE
jgi:D-apionolactonase